MIVTIDGPSGAGKSTVSKMVARELGFAFLDTGALYRAVALGASLAGWEEETSEEVVAAQLTRLEIESRLEDGRFEVLLGGTGVEPFIRNERIGGIASRLSAMAPVRGFLLELQRAAGRAGDLVAEGRDMGTVVFPRAECKFFLDADSAERARRRFAELEARGLSITLDEVVKDLAARDERDRQRAESPLKPAGDAVVVDSTSLDIGQVAALMVERVRSFR